MKLTLILAFMTLLFSSCASTGYRDAHQQRTSLHIPKASIEESRKEPEELNTFLSVSAYQGPSYAVGDWNIFLNLDIAKRYTFNPLWLIERRYDNFRNNFSRLFFIFGGGIFAGDYRNEYFDDHRRDNVYYGGKLLFEGGGSFYLGPLTYSLSSIHRIGWEAGQYDSFVGDLYEAGEIRQDLTTDSFYEFGLSSEFKFTVGPGKSFGLGYSAGTITPYPKIKDIECTYSYVQPYIFADIERYSVAVFFSRTKRTNYTIDREIFAQFSYRF